MDGIADGMMNGAIDGEVLHERTEEAEYANTQPKTLRANNAKHIPLYGAAKQIHTLLVA